MKNFFKKPANNKESNILIEYTKWLIKIISLIFLLCLFGLGILIWLEDKTENINNAELLYLQCTFKEDNSKDLLLSTKSKQYEKQRKKAEEGSKSDKTNKKLYKKIIGTKFANGTVEPRYTVDLNKNDISEETRDFVANLWFQNYSDIAKIADRYKIANDKDLYFLHDSHPYLLEDKKNVVPQSDLPNELVSPIRTLNRKTLVMKTYAFGQTDKLLNEIHCKEISKLWFKYQERKLLKEYFKDIKI